MAKMNLLLVLVWTLGFSAANGWRTLSRVSSISYRVSYTALQRRLEPLRVSVSAEKDFVPTAVVPSPFTGSGCVLLSQPNETFHALLHSALLVFSHSDKSGTQAVQLDRVSAFRMGDSLKVAGPFDGNPLFLGGETGSETAVMLHGRALQTARPLGHGLYLGGMATATELIDSMRAAPRDFKFVFNYVYWRPGALQQELDARRWDVCLLPPALALCQTRQRLWHKARRALREAGALIDMAEEESERE